MMRKYYPLLFTAWILALLAFPALAQEQASVDRIAPLLNSIQERDSTAAAAALRAIDSPLDSNEADRLIQALEQLAPSGSWAPVLEAIVEKNPDHGILLYHLARIYWRSGEDSKAMHYSREAYNADSSNSVILYGISAIAFATHDYESAKLWLHDLLEKDPEHVDGKFLQVSIAVREGKYDEALPILLQLVQEQPRHALARYELGKIFNRMNESKLAEHHLTVAIREQPFFEDAYNALVVALARQGRSEDVVKYRAITKYLSDWNEIKQNRLNYSFRHPNEINQTEASELAAELCQVGREDLAEKYLEYRQEQAALSDPQRMILARIKFNQQEYPDALRLLSEIQNEEIIDSNPFAIFKAWSLFYMKLYEQGRAYLKEVVEKYPDSNYLQTLMKEYEKLDTDDSLSTEKKGAEFSFIDATEKANLHSFEHRIGNPEKIWITDAMGSGVAVGDFDKDGDDDVYFVNARPELLEANANYRNALFRNDDGTFVDVTIPAGVGDTGFGMCALFGDIDNDGWPDLFVGNDGANVLYRNNGDGTFTDITEKAGVGDAGYAAAAAFADVDRDGDLDLYIGNYVDFDPAVHGHLRTEDVYGKVFMGPLKFDGQLDMLYMNNGEGIFINQAEKAGINVSLGRAMGVVFIDLDNDNNLDLYVTNDSTYNHVLKNRGDGTFEDISFISGGAFTENGFEGASMGVAAGDYNNDGFMDIHITSYEKQTDVLYMSDGQGMLQETTGPSGLMAFSRMLVTWGTGFSDFDADGELDIYTANGHMYPQIEELNLDRSYYQGVSFYRNTGETFNDLTKGALPDTLRPVSCRGSALLDFDSDGDMDVVVNCIDSPPLLLENRSPQGKWLQVNINAPDAVRYGMRIAARKGDRVWTRIIDGGSGYLSQNSPIVHFGFGEIDSLDELMLFWPDQDPQLILNPPLNARIRIDYEPPSGSRTAKDDVE